ncbi:unnamed protein product [Somion occarium]|uniref:HNH nuclease domain-containing protein n=1 Tax=Somion occarium TaxID=3059160 RepID=A0ABP1DX50_9APHY
MAQSDFLHPTLMLRDYDDRYQNEDERNIHVWASARSLVLRLRVIAGCYQHGDLTYDTFFMWLAVIVERGPKELALVHWGDPRIRDLPQDEDALSTWLQQQRAPVIRQGTTRSSNVIPGHYILLDWDPLANTFYLRCRTPLLPEISSRCLSGNGSGGTGASVNRRGRKLVRKRDMACRITQEPATLRPRGANFTALEVAHIYPLAALDQANRLVSASVFPWLSSRDAADMPYNAILLRSDIHNLFDDYQFSVWKYGRENRDNYIYRFEKGGAPGMQNYKQIFPPRPATEANLTAGHASVTSTDDVSWDFFNVHFRTALLWHVSGQGRSPSTNAVLTAEINRPDQHLAHYRLQPAYSLHIT